MEPITEESSQAINMDDLELGDKTDLSIREVPPPSPPNEQQVQSTEQNVSSPALSMPIDHESNARLSTGRSGSVFALLRGALTGTANGSIDESGHGSSDQGVKNNDAMLIEADMLLSDPYKGSLQKFNQLRELYEEHQQELESVQGSSHGDLPAHRLEMDTSMKRGRSESRAVYADERKRAGTIRANVGENTSPLAQDGAKNARGNSLSNLTSPPATVSSTAPESPVKMENLPAAVASDIAEEKANIYRTQRMNIDEMRAIKVREFSITADSETYETTLELMYSQLKDMCSEIDKGAEPSFGETKTPFLKKIYFRQLPRPQKSALKRIFGNGFMEGTTDFLKLNFPVNFDNFYSENLCNEDAQEQTTSVIYKSTLFIRRYTIWFAFYTASYPVKGILTADGLFMFVPKREFEKFEREVLNPLEKVVDTWKLENLSHQKARVPFEQDVMRALLIILGAKHKAEFYHLQTKVQSYLDMLRTIKKNKKNAMLSFGLQLESYNLKNDITRMISRMTSNMEALETVLGEENAEECLTLLSLSAFRDDPSLYAAYSVAEDVKIISERVRSTLDRKYHNFGLIEHYMDKFVLDHEAIAKKMKFLSTLIENEESLFQLALNYSQNEILILNTAMTILACAIGFSGYITGGFGMNLDNTKDLQSTKHSFAIVFACSFLGLVVIFWVTYRTFIWKGILPEIVGKKSNVLNKLSAD